MTPVHCADSDLGKHASAGCVHLGGMRAHADQPEHAPVSLRTVVLDITDDGSMHVTIDGAPLEPDETERPWTRGSFPQVIDRASEDRTWPVRVEVHEADGTSFTDLLPARPPRPSPTPELASVTKPRKTKVSQRLIEVTAEGFIPGEDVACCLLTSHTDATPAGQARALVEAKQAAGTGEVVLLGRVSGHVVVRRLP